MQDPLFYPLPKPDRIRKEPLSLAIMPDVRNAIVAWAAHPYFAEHRLGPTPGNVVTEMLRALLRAGWEPGKEVQIPPIALKPLSVPTPAKKAKK